MHPDPRVRDRRAGSRSGDVASDRRLRLVHSERRKTVYILCSIPLDIPVEELVTWKQLITDPRLIDALKT